MGYYELCKTRFSPFFYRDKNGVEPVHEYINELLAKNDKDSRINVNKIPYYVDYLRRVGIEAREPYVKHLAGIFGN